MVAAFSLHLALVAALSTGVVMRLTRSDFWSIDMHVPLRLTLLIVFGLLALPTMGQETPVSAKPERLGLVQILDVVELPAREDGVLLDLTHHVGDNVVAGETVARIDATQAELELSVALAELQQAQRTAADDAKVRKAESAVEVARTEFKISEPLYQRGVVTLIDFEKIKAALQQAEIEAEGERNTLEILEDAANVRQSQHDLAAHRVNNRVITAPFDGAIESLLKHQGEWVEQGNGILRVVRLDRLRVQAFVDPEAESPLLLAQRRFRVVAQISPDEEESFEQVGGVTFSPSVEADGQLVVWLEVENRQSESPESSGHWLLRPGMPVSVELLPVSPPVPAREP